MLVFELNFHSDFAFFWFAEDRSAQLYLCCASLPPTIDRISFRYELCLKELGIRHCHFEQFTVDDTTIGWTNVKKPKWTDIVALDRLTFTVDIHLIDIYNVHSVKVGHSMMTRHLSPIEGAHCVVTRYLQGINGPINGTASSPPPPPPPSAVTDTIMRFVGGIVKESRVRRHEYEWTISDPDSVSKLKQSANGSIFRGQLFQIEGFKFLMQICPNGSNPLREGSFNWYIYAASMPPKVAKLVFDYRFCLKEANAMDTDCKELRVKSSSWGWGNDILKSSDIQQIESFHFVLEMAVIDVYQHDGRLLDRTQCLAMTDSSSSSLSDYVLMDDILWIIEDPEMLNQIRRAKTGECLRNEPSGNSVFQWRLLFYPNGTTLKFRNEAILEIELMAMPPNVSGISVYFELHILETNTRWTHCSHFRKDHLTQGWETARVKFAAICALNKVSLRAKLYLVDVYDSESNAVTQQYVDDLPSFTDDDQFVV